MSWLRLSWPGTFYWLYRGLATQKCTNTTVRSVFSSLCLWKANKSPLCPKEDIDYPALLNAEKKVISFPNMCWDSDSKEMSTTSSLHFTPVRWPGTEGHRDCPYKRGHCFCTGSLMAPFPSAWGASCWVAPSGPPETPPSTLKSNSESTVLVADHATLVQL